jgi:hypothetical protein
MRPASHAITATKGHIRWSLATGDLPPVDSPVHEHGGRPRAAAVSGLAQAARVKRIAASLPGSDLRSQLEAGAARSIEDILDEWCGGCGPGCRLAPCPQARAIAIAAEVAAMANALPAGLLHDELLRIAGQELVRPFGRRLS